MKKFLPLMTHTEAQDAIGRRAVAILPIGTIESNGPAVPLGLDYLISDALATAVAQEMDAVRLPAISFGVSGPIADFPGTVYVTPSQLQAQVESILMSLVCSGWKRVLLITNHLPNQYPIEQACRAVRRATGVVVPSIFPSALINDLASDLFEGLAHTKGHGSEPGLSLMLHLHPESVRLEEARVEGLREFAGFQAMSPLALRHRNSSVSVALDLSDVTTNGAWGDPSQASPELGAEIMNRMVDFVVSFLSEFDPEINHSLI